MIASMRVDVARYDNEDTVIEIRYKQIDISNLSREVKAIINSMQVIPSLVIDETGLGAALVDTMRLETL